MMSEFTVSIKPTSNERIIKFEINNFITDHSSYEYENIDAAQNSPLAQQLFYLPFVKTVYISGNFIAIERFDIVEWADVQEEVKDQISEYLNSGAVVVEEGQKKKLPVTIYAESTPNPAALKFVANKKLVPQLVEFTSIDEAVHSPLATELFKLPFVKQVFIDDNYISITKYDVAEWQEITQPLREQIREFLENGGEVLSEAYKQNSVAEGTDSAGATKDLDPTSQQIVQILDEYVKPAVASDGGHIQFDSYNPETKNVRVILQGACSGCPSSTFTLKNGIENMLKEFLQDKVETVEAING